MANDQLRFAMKDFGDGSGRFSASWQALPSRNW